MELEKNQADVFLPFYLICPLHLANENGLRLEQQSVNCLDDFMIYAKRLILTAIVARSKRWAV